MIAVARRSRDPALSHVVEVVSAVAERPHYGSHTMAFFSQITGLFLAFATIRTTFHEAAHRRLMAPIRGLDGKYRLEPVFHAHRSGCCLSRHGEHTTGQCQSRHTGRDSPGRVSQQNHFSTLTGVHRGRISDITGLYEVECAFLAARGLRAISPMALDLGSSGPVHRVTE